jgi:hypothetical protein
MWPCSQAFVPTPTPQGGVVNICPDASGTGTPINPFLGGVDSSLSKSIPVERVSETFKVQFRADFFNIINRANFTSPNDNRAVINPDGTAVPFAGKITLTNTTSRQIQFSLKFSW